MPKIADRTAALKLRDRLTQTNDHASLAWYRKIRDRQMQDKLELFRQALAPGVQQGFVPFQDPEPDEVVRKRSRILASNPVAIEVFAQASSAKNKAQDFEEALEALLDGIVPIESRADECDDCVGDGLAVRCVEYAMPEVLKGYSDHDALKKHAESDDEDDDDERSARSSYRRHYRDVTGERASDDEKRRSDPGHKPKKRPTDPHDETYSRATEEAMMYAPLTWSSRMVDWETFWFFPGVGDEVSIGMEDGQVAVNPALETLSGYGVTLKGGRWELAHEGEATGDPAYALVGMLPESTGQLDDQAQRVRYTRIATKDEIVILVDHPNAAAGSEEDVFFTRFKNPMAGRSSGYYITPAAVKNRGKVEERYRPMALPMYVIAQGINYAVSAQFGMAFEEAMREPHSVRVGPRVPPIDSTQDGKAKVVKAGAPPPSLPGGTEIIRAPSTGIDVAQLSQWLDDQKQKYRDDPFFTGSGSSAESGQHLSRLQTAAMTDLAPIQARRAITYKRILMDVVHAEGEAGRTLYIPYAPKEQRSSGEYGRVAEPRKITPDMVKLPLDVQLTIGAESPETEYAKQQAARQNEAAGVYGMTRVREIVGVKNPQEEERQLTIDNVMKVMTMGDGTKPGWLVTTVVDETKIRIAAMLDAAMGIPEAPPAPPGMGPDGMPLDSSLLDTMNLAGQNGATTMPAGYQQPVQHNQTGAPMTSGVEGMPV